MDTVAGMMLTHFWLKFTDMILFKIRVVTCVHISNIEVFDPEGSYTKGTCINILFYILFYIFLNLMMAIPGRNM
jgi:hypothetical protein